MFDDTEGHTSSSLNISSDRTRARTLGADEELLQVQARVVLPQLAQHVEHAPICQHHLQPQHRSVEGAVPAMTKMSRPSM